MREKTPNPSPAGSSVAERFHRVEDIFHRARALDPTDRATFLDEACEEDLVLRRDVESLLLHSEQATTAVAIPRPGDSRIIDRGPVSEGPGTRIGPYKILQQIGEGGFGVVYMAEQQHPVRRKVALKIIKLGMDTKQVIARFEAERQALALMDHPNIAKVLDAGATETGRPYFVMELVRGIPITQYCDEQRLSTRQRLGLFLHVCFAIAHAHQKGIIHRDIKPSNVLVTLHDDIPVPKVIDFGIAKATSSRLTDKTLFTEFRQFIGTPEYMSPDQADISGLDIDTRTDIYSLGVLLYELLTGTTPLDPQTLRTAPDIQRIIREAEPPLPSTRVHAMGRRGGHAHKGNGDGRAGSTTPSPPVSSSSSSKGSLADIARHRRIEPSGLLRMLRGDLDWIVMKAMEKDRTRRYQTANELAADVRRHLDNEPVLAGPPSAVYVMRKFIRRHKVGVTVTMLVAGAVLVLLPLASVGWVRASNEAAHSREVSEFLQSVIIDVDQTGGGLSTDEVVGRGRELFGDDHAIVGNLLTTRASSLSNAGRGDDAVEAQREALAFLTKANGPEHPSVAAATSRLAELLEERRDVTEAEQLYRTALEMKRELFGEKSQAAADAMESLTSLLVETGGQTAHEEIKSLWRETIDAYEASLGPESPTTVKQLCQFGCWMAKSGHVEEAAQILPEAMERARRVLREDDLIRFTTVDCYAQTKLYTGDYAEVIPLIEELRDLAAHIWVEDFTVQILVQSQLVVFNSIIGDRPAAEREFEALVKMRTEHGAQSSPHPYTFQISQGILRRMGDWLDEHPDEGRTFAMLIAADAESLTQERTEQRAGSLSFAASWLCDHEFYADAEPLLVDSIETYRGLSPSTDKARTENETELAATLACLADNLIHQDRALEAESAIRECIEIRERVLEPDDRWLVDNARSILGSCLAAQGMYEDAERILLDSYDKLRMSILVPADNQRLARERVIDLYEKWGRDEEAEKFRAPVKPIDPTS